MKYYHIRKGLFAGILAAVLMGSLTGCGKSRQEKGAGSEGAGQDKAAALENAGQDGPDLKYSVEEYRERMLPERVELSAYQEQYEQEAADVLAVEYQNVHFEGCEFLDLPETEALEMMVGMERDISVQESWDTIKDWLEQIGKPDAIDMKKDVRIVTSQLETDDEAEPPYCYPCLYEHMQELDSGSGALVNCSQCHMQIAGNGIYSMSDGKITEYLGLETRAVRDATGDNIGNTVESGTLAEMGGKKYELTAGKLSVQKGAELVKEFFQAGTPFACGEEISIDVPWVQVCRLGDVYAYDYMVRRIYRGVPFIYMDHGSYRFDGGYTIGGDTKHAYVVDDTGVSAFHGYNEAEKLIPLVEDSRIIGVKQMAEILGEGLAPHVDIHATSVGLAYLPVVFGGNYEERMIFPCWQLTGESRTKGRHIGVFVDAFTGEIYYYT